MSIPDLPKVEKEWIKEIIKEALSEELEIPKKRVSVHWNTYHRENPWRRIYAAQITVSRERFEWSDWLSSRPVPGSGEPSRSRTGSTIQTSDTSQSPLPGIE